VIRIRHEWRATRGTCTSRVGDSGAPVFVERHGRAYAVGILSGGQQRASQCPFYFTSVTLALSTLHLRLLSR
jgi:Trypsin